MRSVFENVSTRIFCIYGELSDIFCLPDTRILNFEEYLVKRLQDLGYSNVVFVSTQREMCYAVDSLGVAGIDILSGKKPTKAEDPPKVQASQETNKKNQISSKYIDVGKGSNYASSVTKNSSDQKEEKLKYTYQIKNDQLADAPHRYMCDVSSPKVLVFTSIEDIIRISDQKEGRKLIERFEEWKSLPNENRNICIFLSKTLNSSELQNILVENKNAVLESLFFDNNVFNMNSCINICNPMNDEIHNLSEYLRINGYTYFKEDNTEFTAKLLYNCNEDNLRAIERMLCFYCRENGYRQLKDLKELLEQYMKKCGTAEVWLTQECIPLLFPNSGKLYDDDDDPMEKLRTTDGWEPAYHVIKSFIDHHRALYGNGEKAELSDATDSSALTVDRFEPDEHKNISRCKVPNFVLQGPPGVGKTEIAKLIGQILQREGIIKSGHTVIGTRDKLVGEYVGTTSVKTNALIEEAQEGLLLVDEVYSIAEKSEGVHISYCDEVFSTLVAAMTNSNYHFCIVFAGYASRMNEVWNMNEGLYSRFGASNIITLNEYEPPLLRKIFEGQFGKKEGVTGLVTTLSKEVTDGLDVFFENYFADRDRKDFGNARDINNLVSDVKRCSNYRYLLEIETGERQREQNPKIEVQRSDFAERESLFMKRGGLSTKDIYSSLNNYIGFDFLAKMFNDQLALRVESIEKNILYSGPSHMIWAGNPGTGKSTAAQLTAQLYHSLGIMGGSEPIYVDASELTSIYANGGASNMTKKIDEACQKNTVLVIEEAYQLLDHGQDAIHALLNRMETDRRNFNLILILYKDKVDQFLAQNSGLSSRLLVYDFPDYNAEQLFEIFELMCKKNKDKVDDNCREKMKVFLARLHAEGKTTHGNARIVRQLLDHMKQARYARINNSLAEISGRTVNEIAAARATSSLDTLGVSLDMDKASTFIESDIPGDEICKRFLKTKECLNGI